MPVGPRVKDGLRRTGGYLPIEGYGLIGDCRSAALVGLDGSIDFLCLPRFDSDAVFSRILDATRGGCWEIRPAVTFSSRQHYRDRTNLLDSIFTTGTGIVALTDYMPVDERDIEAQGRFRDEPRIVRHVECLAGHVRMRHVYDPRPGFAREQVALTVESDRHVHADAGRLRLCLTSTVDLGPGDTTFTLRAGEAAAFALRCGRSARCGAKTWSVERSHELFRATRSYWWQWIERCRYSGPYQEHVWRSALALKLMTYAPTGAIVAAPTTSLPETIGGPRNWDYRFTWLRDASFTLYAFFQLGLTDEANGFFHWLAHRHLGRRGETIPNLFDLAGRGRNTELELDNLEGYRKSRPVRVGNAAVDQLQLDVYGEVLDSAYIFARFGGDLTQELWRELRAIVDIAIERWQQPDSSIWEVRSQRLQYTYSKLMCWVAVDRGLRIAERYRLEHDPARWKAARRAMHRRITAEGFSETRGAFTQYLGGDALDAAVLRVSQIRFLRDRDPRVRSTIEAVEEHLGSGVLVRRYRMDESEDGLRGSDGAFFMTSFWLVDAIAHTGDVIGASRRFERLLHFASPLGLFSEEVDANTGQLLGNYPQAFTHLSLVSAAVNIERARRRELGVRGLRR
ncbi:MAG: glycoside hydrolase family 15 protein [Chloroflexi bacterium]|nr:MAG: glycoside hydrolase family 15 protein [Chloroflexota bacterium]